MMATTRSQRTGAIAHRLRGDGLVPVDSALGRHHPRFAVAFPPEHQHLVYGSGHLDLLGTPEVGGASLPGSRRVPRRR